METTYTIYMLVENEKPYYVGCTSLGDRRYWAGKRKQFEALDTTTDNKLATLLEIHWVDILRSWGFNLKNDTSVRPYPIKENAIAKAALLADKRRIKKEKYGRPSSPEPTTIQEKWAALRSEGDPIKIANASGLNVETIRIALRKNVCSDKVFKAIADYYEAKGKLVAQYV